MHVCVLICFQYIISMRTPKRCSHRQGPCFVIVNNEWDPNRGPSFRCSSKVPEVV